MAYEVIVGRSEADKKRYATKGCVLLGKHYVKMGQTSSLSNEIWMDVTRSHVVFLCGKRGSGKCLTGDALIPVRNGRLVPIKRLYEEQEGVYGLGKDLKIRPMRKEGFYKRKVRRILKIRLRSGKEISLTPEHPLLTIRGWVQAQHLTVNDRIATPRKIPHNGKATLRAEEVAFIAYMLAEGHITDRIARFTNFDRVIIHEFHRIVDICFANTRVTRYKQGQFGLVNKTRQYTKKERTIEGYRAGLAQKSDALQRLIELGLHGLKAGQKFVPSIIFEQDKKNIAVFLNRLFSCDGTIHNKRSKGKDHWQISYASKSQVLIKQVQHLLLRFSISSRVRERYIKQGQSRHRNYDLIITHPVKYIEQIGFTGEKVALQEPALKHYASITRNPNTDTVPREIWEFYRPKSWAAVGRSLNYAYPKALRESMRYSPSRQKLLQIARADKRDDIRLIAEADLFWDHIAAVEDKQGNFEVYDITVPENHNFIANDIIVHNSYTMSVVAEGISNQPPEIAKNIGVLMFDTMGIFWTMKYPNQRQRELLDEWGMKPESLNVNVVVPAGRLQELVDGGLPVDAGFTIDPAELEPSQWPAVYGVDPTQPVGGLLEYSASELKEQGSFSLEDLAAHIGKQKVGDDTKRAAQNLVRSAEDWGIFEKHATPIQELIEPGKVTVLDISTYATAASAWNVRALVIGLVCQKLFANRMEARKREEHEALQAELSFHESSGNDEPVIWVLIDEAHEFLPRDGSTPATNALVTLLREGRQPGISLVLASQQPGKIHTDVMTQSDIIISHRITAKIDTDALGMLTQSYMRADLDVLLNDLPRVKGAAVILDDANEKLYSMRVRPRFTWHGGDDPNAMKEHEKI